MFFLETIVDLFVEMSLYMVIGLLLVGILHVFINKEWLIKQLGNNNIVSVIKSAVMGVPLPLCSCGVVPTAIELKKRGASNGAVLSFLISTPQTGIDSIIATWGIIGPFMAIFRAITAFISGIVGGIISNIFAGKEKIAEVKKCCCSSEKEEVKNEEKLSFGQKIKKIFTYGFGTFLDEISIHFVIGILVSAIISVIIPEDFFINYGINDGIIAMILMIIIGLPMYICSTSSIPVALSLIMKGLSPGAAFVFLFTGPVTNIASLIVLSKTFGKKLLSIYLISVIILSIIFGYVFNYIIETFNINIIENMSHMHHSENDIIVNAIAIVFSILLCISIIKNIKNRINTKK